MKIIHLSEIEGFLVGHSVSEESNTGCTAILCPGGASASIHVPGFASSTRETELLTPASYVTKIYGLSLSGGGAFGLSVANGVERFLAERDTGFKSVYVTIPTVTGATLFDYPVNASAGKLPNEQMGYEAAASAVSGPLKSGPYGVGRALRSGRLMAHSLHSVSGLGSYGVALDSGLRLAALAAVNSLGSIINPRNGEIVSGVRHADGTLLNRFEMLHALSLLPWDSPASELGPTNTVVVAVATNATLDKVDAYRLARMAAAGISMATYPAHLLYDGDVVFAMSSCTEKSWNISFLGALAAEVVAGAILRSVPEYNDLP
ncbi:MAG: P1 family peptidase [Deltaproteobacteria bacterium]|jgi:L-aminopeptidase/D-esterase-like protein|nr:P1 family peptidase [Deltaproteobacteria bacterium]